MSVMPYAAAPGRECGSCGMCCKVYALPGIGEPAGVWCLLCTPVKGCNFHDAHCDPCIQFFCLWNAADTRPCRRSGGRSHARFVLTVAPTNGFIYGQVDPGSPGASPKAPYYGRLRAIAKTLLDQRRHVIMFSPATRRRSSCRMRRCRLGKWTPKDNFRVEQVFGPKGPNMARGEDLERDDRR